MALVFGPRGWWLADGRASLEISANQEDPGHYPTGFAQELAEASLRALECEVPIWPAAGPVELPDSDSD